MNNLNRALGHNPAEVIELLNRRAHNKNKDHNDGRKIALIVEGGGMRGVLSAGSLFALDILGYHNAFDEVYATSAGGVNAAYFLSGQGALGISVYFDDISSLRFANPLRFWKIIDVDYVYDHIVPHIKVLNEQSIRTGRPNFHLGLTDVASGKNLMMDVKKSSFKISSILKASSAIPVLYNRTVQLGSNRYVDGGLTDILPIARAVHDGCTDILVLTTRLPGRVSKRPPNWERAIFYIMMGWRFPHLQHAYVSNFQRTIKSREISTGREILHGANIATICPTEEELVVGRVTLDRSTLLAGAKKMGIRTARLMGQTTTDVEIAFDRLAAGTAD